MYNLENPFSQQQVGSREICIKCCILQSYFSQREVYVSFAFEPQNICRLAGWGGGGGIGKGTQIIGWQ